MRDEINYHHAGRSLLMQSLAGRFAPVVSGRVNPLPISDSLYAGSVPRIEVRHAPSPKYTLLPVPALAPDEPPHRSPPDTPGGGRPGQSVPAHFARDTLHLPYSSGLPARSDLEHPPSGATSTRSDTHRAARLRSVLVPRPPHTPDARRPTAERLPRTVVAHSRPGARARLPAARRLPAPMPLAPP